MSLCSALLSVNSASWKVDWREGADLTCLVSHFVEEGADQSDVLEALKELQEGGSKEAGWKELSCQWWLLVTNLIMFVWIHLLCLAVPFLVAWWKDGHRQELQRWRWEWTGLYIISNWNFHSDSGVIFKSIEFIHGMFKFVTNFAGQLATAKEFLHQKQIRLFIAQQGMPRLRRVPVWYVKMVYRPATGQREGQRK